MDQFFYTIGNIVRDFFGFFQNLVPGGLGLLLLPLAGLGIVSLLVARR
jgi:hypothetical protein